MIEESKCCPRCCSFGMLLGRWLLSIIFILSGIGKLLDYSGTAHYMTAQGMTFVPFFLIAAALVEIIFGLAVFLGFKARLGALVLMLFLIPVTLIFHDFWNQGPETYQLQMIMFMKNVAIFGGLLILACAGPGKLSLDAYNCCKVSSTCCK